MLEYLIKFVRWIFEKFAAAVLIIALGLGACGLWLFLKDNVSFDQWRRDLLREISGDRAKVIAAMSDVRHRMARFELDIATEQERVKQADKIIAELRDLESTWDKYVGNPAQQKANAEQMEKITALRTASTAKIQQLKEQLTRTTWERDGLQIALEKVEARRKMVEEQQSRVMHYLERTWNHPFGPSWMQIPAKWWVAVVLVVYFVGPTIGKMGMYYLVAPLVAGGRPVRLAETLEHLPGIGESEVATEIALKPGERLWVKEEFLQASDEGVGKKTRYLLDWRIPFTCMATGLTELVELRHAHDGAGERCVTLSNQKDPHSELAVVNLPAGASLILRPSFLAGASVAEGQRLAIRRRWQIFRWVSWVTLQFRFFEFAGPCQLVIVGKRGVRAERLVDREGMAIPARRTNQDATMGFTPNLDYRPVRAETFWSYYRGMNPLFDDLFAGRGIFLCQQVSAAGENQKARKFWAGMWGGVMKVFGM